MTSSRGSGSPRPTRSSYRLEEHALFAILPRALPVRVTRRFAQRFSRIDAQTVRPKEVRPSRFPFGVRVFQPPSWRPLQQRLRHDAVALRPGRVGSSAKNTALTGGQNKGTMAVIQCVRTRTRGTAAGEALSPKRVELMAADSEAVREGNQRLADRINQKGSNGVAS